MYECLELNGVTAHDQPIIHLHHVIGLGIELHMSFGAFELPDDHAERLA